MDKPEATDKNKGDLDELLNTSFGDQDPVLAATGPYNPKIKEDEFTDELLEGTELEQSKSKSKGKESDSDAMADDSSGAVVIKPNLRTRSRNLNETQKKPQVAKRSSGRLRDPEFLAKHKAFLQKVNEATKDINMDILATPAVEKPSSHKRKLPASAETEAALEPVAAALEPASAPEPTSALEPASKQRKLSGTAPSGLGGKDTKNDCYCWICHKEGEVICCETCPRVFHLKCIPLEQSPTEDWVCPECVLIMTAENMETRSRAMRLLSVDQFRTLLKFSLNRMRSISSIEPFTKPVDPQEFPAYKDYISFPTDLLTIEKNIKKKNYGSTEAFLADIKWILHNCIIFNSTSSKLTSVAKALVKVCKQEMQEIENCPDCYTNAHLKKDSWFVSACRIPHLLVWARLKGYPFWPGKVFRVGSDDTVDVRFFGAHDRAWIPLKDVFLFSEESPGNVKHKRKGNFDECMEEVDLYLKAIRDKFGKFQHAPPKTPFDPKAEEEQIKMLYPNCSLPFEIGPARRRIRTYSFSGSERSHAGTPTPSEIEMSEEPFETQSKVEETANETKPESAPKGDEAVEMEQQDKTKKPPLIKEVAVAKENDRSAVSPPCEVSSTTNQTEEKKNANTSKPSIKSAPEEEKPETNTETNQVEKPVVALKVAVIAETSETVEIEGEIEEEEVTLDEEIDDVELEIDDVEPRSENEEQKDKPENTNTSSTSPIQTKEGGEDKEEITEEKKPEKSNSVQEKVSPTKVAVSEDEIDDVEPDVEEILDDDDEAVDTSRLLASGVSVTVVDKSKKSGIKEKVPEQQTKEPEKTKEAAPLDPKKVMNDIGLSSDISVTVVQKKKAEDAPKVANLPRISVKKESELLIDAVDKASDKQDIVNVHLRKAKKSFPRKSVEEMELSANESNQIRSTSVSKSLPEPIVTISKVQGGASSGNKDPPKDITEKQQPLPKPATKPNSPSVSMPVPQPGSSLLLRPPSSSMSQISQTPVTSVPGSLASILGSPRVSLPPGFRAPLRPPMSSPLMRAPAPQQSPRGQLSSSLGMPSLHPRPGGSFSASPLGNLPQITGPVSEQMHKIAGKLVDSMRATIEDVFREVANQGSPESQVKMLQLEIEKLNWRHQQELSEMKHNTDLIVLEMRQSMEAEKQKVIADLKKQAEIEKQKVIAETKKKQWCAHCGKEAIFYCCWNTSYCDYPCQQAHWPSHMATCAQNQSNQDEEGNPNDNSESMDHSGAGNHFLNSPSNPGPSAIGASMSSRNAANAAMRQAAAMRGIQGGPGMMPGGPIGMNPRLMSQMAGMRFPRGSAPPHASGSMMFPGAPGYFM